MTQISRQEMEDVAEKVANKVLSQYFLFLDVDPTKPEDVRRLRNDLMWLSQQREGSVYLKQQIRHYRFHLLGVAATALVYGFWDVLKEAFGLVISK